MKIKKSLLASLSSILLMPLISAYGYIDLRYGMNQVIQWIQDFLSPIFEVLLGDYSGSEFFLAKALLLILLFVIITFVLDKAKLFGELKDKPGIIYIVSAVVSILSIRFLPENDIIKGILLPYSALGIALTTFLPLLIFFFFLHNSDIKYFGRRAGWILYAIIFLALWASKEVQLSDTSNWIYWTALGFVILSFMFDKSIHGYFGSHEIGKFLGGVTEERIVRLQEEYSRIKTISTFHADSRRKKIEQELRKLNAQIP